MVTRTLTLKRRGAPSSGCQASNVDKEMKNRYTLTCFLVIAALIVFAQSNWLITVRDSPPEMAEWLAEYRLKSSIEAYGISILLLFCSFGMWRSSRKAIYWMSFVVILLTAWMYLGRELLTHFVELPKRLEGANLSTPPYFTFEQPLAYIPRVAWHILIPISIILTFHLLIKPKRIEQGGDGDAEEAV